MKPSIGRIVHYRVAGPDTHPELVAAIITRVWSDTCVNLRLIGDAPTLGDDWVTSVEQGDGPGRWRWPERV